MMNLAALLQSLRFSLLHIENRILQVAGIERQLVPALAINGRSLLPHIEEQQLEEGQSKERPPGLLDSIFWMAAPKKRRTIEVNRTRRRAESKLIKVKQNIEPCPECGHLKQKHILCGFCYAKVCQETGQIRQQIKAMEGGPLRAPTVETVVLYADETPSELDKDKRIVERPRKRPSWFGQ
ncbi:39S ribosomal protein L32, mitochondrial [Corythoichthys intestinalis]|uniref:39S ribosomal protein L32, mitochondrial n=1 Tax=Corythoichthys intestinalis TaxID=161448 RepID=UPI0025A4DA23|nr:39S ribosomal protein L32, mitochondrial [Corythoichthys intestinalis]XP_061789652.1 large ribosomal subunit protein bL32m-like [Nerophis lumbriciformis]